MGKKILIIGHNEKNLYLLSTILKCGGYDTVEAKDSLEGIRLAAVENPQLILMDIYLPLMDGFELYRLLRSRRAAESIPFIALEDSQVLEKKRDVLIKAGFSDCLERPVKLKELLRTIEGHIEPPFRRQHDHAD